MDIAEDEQALTLTADIPGVKLEEIDLKVEDGTLTFSGKREFEMKEDKGAYHRIERSYGAFQRAFSLPDTVDVEKVAAAYDNGVLKVTLPSSVPNPISQRRPRRNLLLAAPRPPRWLCTRAG